MKFIGQTSPNRPTLTRKRASLKTWLRLGAATVTLMATLPCLAMDTGAAERALMIGHVDEAVPLLQTAVAQNPKDGKAHLLLCRAFYSEQMAEEAVAECEAALATTLGNNSAAQDWMGRSYGMKANNAGPIEGYRLAKKVKSAFEASVQLDPRNADAADDLGEFYIEAPGIVGGGVEKATALADSVQNQLPQVAHRLRGLAAQHEKDYVTAEAEFRAAVGVAGRPDAWADLGQFYARRKDGDRTVDAIRHCLAADKANDASVVDAANILEMVHREPQLAEKAFRAYLDKGLKSDAQPVFKVHTDLGKLLASNGDKDGARTEFSKALELAKGYAPAKKAIQSL